MAVVRKPLFIFLCAIKLTTVTYIALLNHSYLNERNVSYTDDELEKNSTSPVQVVCESRNRTLHNELVKVIAYSLYGNTQNDNIRNRYFKQVESRAREIEMLYKGRLK